MLPPFIIEQIRKREEDVRRESERPVVRLPIDDYPPMMPEQREDEEGNRGVVIIDL